MKKCFVILAYSSQNHGMNLYFTSEIRVCLGLFVSPMAAKNVLKLNVQWRCSIPNGKTNNWPSLSRRHRTWSFQVVREFKNLLRRRRRQRRLKNEFIFYLRISRYS